MSKESGSIPFLPQRSTTASPGRASGDLIVRIIEIPSALSNTTKLAHIKGQIIDLPDDNTAILRTPQGDIKVQSPNARDLTRGQPVEIDLPAGHPPRQATLKGGRSDIQQPTTQPRPSPENSAPKQSTLNSEQRPSLRHNLSFEDIELLQRNATKALSSTHANSRSLQVGQTVQATPISTSELAEFLTRISSYPSLNAALHPSTFQTNTALSSSLYSLNNNAIGQLFLHVNAQNIGNPQFLSSLGNLTGQIKIPNAINNFGGASQIHASGTSLQGILSDQTFKSIPSTQQVFSGSFLGVHKGGHIQFSTAQTSQLGIAQSGTGQSFLYGLSIGTSLTSSSGILGFANSTAGTLTALVTGHTDSGRPVVSFQTTGLSNVSSESFVLKKTAHDIPVGSILKFLPTGGHGLSHANLHGVAAPLSAYQGLANVQTPAPIMSTWTDFLALGLWSSFQQVYTAGTKSPIDGTRHALSRMLPNSHSPNTMGASMLFFLAAMKSGDIENFLGKDLFQWLQSQGHGGLLSKLKTELGHLSRLSSEPISGEWRALIFPYYAQGEIEKIRMYYRHNSHGRKDDSENETGKFTRFIMDIPLSRMGDIQVDGLVRDKKLDIVLRTGRPLSTPMQQVMRQKYINALENSDMSGELHFQGNSEQWVHIYNDDHHFGAQI